MNLFRRGDLSRRELRRSDMAYAAMGDWIAWSQARDLKDLGDLTATWLEGGTSYCPGYWATEPDPETKLLIGYLAAYNRAGFVTHASQPGDAPRRGTAQRAWVEGWCTEATSEQIENIALGTDLIVGRTPPGATNTTRICVTVLDYQPLTVAGAMPSDYLFGLYRDVIPAALPNLVNAWQVFVVDPQWGRNDLLWRTVADAIVPAQVGVVS